MAKQIKRPWKFCKTKDGYIILDNFFQEICRMEYDDIEEPENRANANLIAEAGMVAYETGLTPRQLVKQRAELLKACKKMAELFDKDTDLMIEGIADICEAIAQAEGKK